MINEAIADLIHATTEYQQLKEPPKGDLYLKTHGQ
jgi:hypothetical protein